MRLGTHVAGGVLGYTVAATFFHLPWTATGVVVASAAAAAPDVDTLGSTVGRVFAPLARRIERRFGHRTITHCYAAQLAVALAALPLVWLGLTHLYAAAVVGYLSHPFLDTWTTQGVRVFWPWSDRRGVFPYYNRQETAYRTRTGSRADSFFGVVFVLATVPFAVVQHDGYQRLVRRVQADAPAAVRDFLDWSAEGYLVSVDVEASDPQHLRRLAGRFDAVGTTGATTLLVRDSTSGSVFSLGPAYTADFRPARVVAHRGPHVSVSRQTVDMAGRALADLDALVPRTRDGRPVRHLIDGQLTLTEAAGLTPDEFRFNTVSGADRHLALQFATTADLDRLELAGLVAETGQVTLRLFLPDGLAVSLPAADGAARSDVRRVSFAHDPAWPPRLLVAEGDRLALGDTVALLASRAADDARFRVRQAQADVAALLAERPPAAADVPAADAAPLRARLALARTEADRAAERVAAGFDAPARLADARAAVDALAASLAQAEALQSARPAARLGDWRRAHDERLRDARAGLERSRYALAAAERDRVVRSTGAGTVRRIVRRDLGPDRAEVRVVLAAPRPAPATPPPSTHPPRR